MFDINIIFAFLVGVALVLVVTFLFTSKLDRKTIYATVKQALLLSKYAFRDDKAKAIFDTILGIVIAVEQLDKDNLTKQYEAMERAYNEILDKFDVVIDEEALRLLVDIAVAQLPPTNKGVE